MVSAMERITAGVENLSAHFHFLTNKVMTMQEHVQGSLLMQTPFSVLLSASHSFLPTLTHPSGRRYGRFKPYLFFSFLDLVSKLFCGFLLKNSSWRNLTINYPAIALAVRALHGVVLTQTADIRVRHATPSRRDPAVLAEHWSWPLN